MYRLGRGTNPKDEKHGAYVWDKGFFVGHSFGTKGFFVGDSFGTKFPLLVVQGLSILVGQEFSIWVGQRFEVGHIVGICCLGSVSG